MAQIARTEADKAASSAKNAGDKIAEMGKQITDKAAVQAENVVRGGFQSATSGGRCRGRGGAGDRWSRRMPG